jgi:hypothetical protein
MISAFKDKAGTGTGTGTGTYQEKKGTVPGTGRHFFLKVWWP